MDETLGADHKTGMAFSLRALIQKHEVAALYALRMGLSAVLAYLAATLIHPAETSWPVMSAIIMSRIGGQNPGGSALDRLIGTLAGAGVGLLAGFLYRRGVPEYLLLALAITPLAFLSSDRTSFRAAPIAALIVLSATALAKGTGLGPAILRVGDVGLGTAIALFVSQILLPAFPICALRRQTAQLTRSLSNLFALAWRDDADAREKFARLSLRTRRELREATILARSVRQKPKDETGETPANQLVAIIGRINATIAFIARALNAAAPSTEMNEAAAPFLHAVRARLAALGEALAHRGTPPPAPELDTELDGAVSRIEAFAHANPAAHLDALPFLLQTLRDDLNDLAAAAASLPR